MPPLIALPEGTPSIVAHINERLGAVRESGPALLPDFSRAKTVICVSDYAGEHADPHFQVLSFLFADYNNAGLWEAARAALRAGRWKDPSTMQFKKLNKDRARMAALPDFLKAANYISGLSVTFLIDRSIKSLFDFAAGESAATVLAKGGYGVWKPEIAEKLLRVVHFQAFFTAALTAPSHRYVWITDRDAITESPGKLAHLGTIFGKVIDFYCPWKFAAFGYGTELTDAKTHPVNDLLSIPDLIAGAALEFCDSTQNAGGGSEQIQVKSDTILNWVADASTPLRRLFIKLSPDDSGRIAMSIFNFDRKDDGGPVGAPQADACKGGGGSQIQSLSASARQAPSAESVQLLRRVISLWVHNTGRQEEIVHVALKADGELRFVTNRLAPQQLRTLSDALDSLTTWLRTNRETSHLHTRCVLRPEPLAGEDELVMLHLDLDGTVWP